MTQNKRVIGITGGSGCGKSYICEGLAKPGITVIDCDKIARQVVEPGKPCLLELAEFFGNEILEGGALNRKKLAELAFSCPDKLSMLNQITHKYILECIYNRIEKENAGIVLVDGAVLIESGVKCHKMIGVLADREERIKRIMARDGLTREEAERRIDAQKPDSFYKENCDFVIYNSGGEIDFDAIKKRIEE